MDDEDYDMLNKWKSWKVKTNKHSLSVCRRGEVGGKRKRISMSRLIMSPVPYGLQVDHINNNPLDNRRSNLRLCTPIENSRNRRCQRPGRYKGVHKNNSNWMAVIKTGGYLHYLGTFTTTTEAAKAYNTAAIKYFGEFAKLNKIPK